MQASTEQVIKAIQEADNHGFQRGYNKGFKDCKEMIFAMYNYTEEDKKSIDRQ